jgi:hypothetical protein
LSQSIDTKQTIHAKEQAVLYEKLNHLSEVLIKYYDGYVNDIVREYGVESAYRKSYNKNNNDNNRNKNKKDDDDDNDDNDDQYLFDFGALINQNKPLQKFGLYLFLNDSHLDQLDICVDFPLKPNPNYIKNHVEQFGDMYFRYMPSNCGLDYMMNTMSVLMLMSSSGSSSSSSSSSSGGSHDGDKLTAVPVNAQCLLRLDGKNVDDHVEIDDDDDDNDMMMAMKMVIIMLLLKVQ